MGPERNPDIGAQDPGSKALQGVSKVVEDCAAGVAPVHPWGPAVRAGHSYRSHLAVGCANAGYLLVEFIQLSLELLQLLPL